MGSVERTAVETRARSLFDVTCAIHHALGRHELTLFDPLIAFHSITFPYLTLPYLTLPYLLGRYELTLLDPLGEMMWALYLEVRSGHTSHHRVFLFCWTWCTIRGSVVRFQPPPLSAQK